MNLIIENYKKLKKIDPTSFQWINDFQIEMRDCGKLGIHLDLISTSQGKLAGFPWWDHADADLRTMKSDEIPLGTTSFPFNDLEQGWEILIWENKGFIFIAENNDPCSKEYSVWFRVDKEMYLQAWQKVINTVRKKPQSYKSIDEALHRPKHVKNLLLGNQALDTLPDEIGNFPNLTYLELSSNSLKKLPDSIGKLKQLRWIDLRFNKIQELPPTFCSLKNLESINLAENQLYKIPECVKDMQKLQVFFVPSNQIPLKTLKRLQAARPDLEIDHSLLN